MIRIYVANLLTNKDPSRHSKQEFYLTYKEASDRRDAWDEEHREELITTRRGVYMQSSVLEIAVENSDGFYIEEKKYCNCCERPINP